MNLLRQKFYEVLRTLLPVVLLVLLLSFTLVRVEGEVIARFLIGSLLLLLGLSIFLLGVDLAMNPIGEHMAKEMATSRTALKILLFSFLLGFLVTVAEPDLMILGKQVQGASGGSINANTMVYAVSAGVGLLISLGSVRLLSAKISYPLFMGLAYTLILGLSFLVSEEFLAISFDSSGATTGALTTPFVLALSLGLSRIKGGKSMEEDSFGMVGAMSAGPIIAVMLMSILTGQGRIRGAVEEFRAAEGILAPLLSRIPHVFIESLLGLLPLCLFFFLMHFIRFKIRGREMARIIKGLIYTLLGLTLFLTGVYAGFMDMGQMIGRGIAGQFSWLLPIIGFVLGMIVVLVEPAVHVLGHQVEDATGGRVPLRLIRMTLSLGVGLAIACSMLRIMIPEVKLWYFLLPGFLTAIILSFRSDPVFVGIAYDAGGVASGPMTATFVLAFAQGAAAVTPTADVLIDGFGVIAMVAMAPVLSIMALGAVFRHKAEAPGKKEARLMQAEKPQGMGRIEMYDCVVAIVSRGLSERAVELAREAGAWGATILHGRGSGVHDVKVFNVEIQKEKEIIFWLTDTRLSRQIASNIWRGLDLGGSGSGTIFMMPSGAFGLDRPVAIGTREPGEMGKDGHLSEVSTAKDLLPGETDHLD